MNRFETELKSKATSEAIYTIWEQIKRESETELQKVNYAFPHYSVHDKSHSEKIADNLAEFIGEHMISELSVSDLLYLLAIIYLHDCGMAIDSKEEKEFWESPEFTVYLSNLKGDYAQYRDEIFTTGKKDGSWPVRVKNYVTFITAEYIRPKHADFSATKVNKFVRIHNPRIIGLLQKSISAHMWDTVKMLNEISIEEDGLFRDKLHPLLLTILLRIGDLLDLDCDRFNHIFIRPEIMPTISKTHKKKHEEISHMLIKPGNSEVEYKCSNPDVFRETKSWLRYLEDETNLLVQIWDIIAPQSCKDIELPQIKAKVTYDVSESFEIHTVTRFIKDLENLYFEYKNKSMLLFEYTFTDSNDQDIDSLVDLIPKKVHDKVALIGSCGCGKSEVLKRIFCYLYEQKDIPIMLNIKRVNALLAQLPEAYSKYEEFEKVLFTSIQPFICKFELFTYRIKKSSVILIVDGINELPSECLGFLLEFFDKIQGQVNLKIIVSSQKKLTIPYFKTYTHFLVKNLNNHQVETLINNGSDSLNYCDLALNTRDIISKPFFLDIILKNKKLLNDKTIEQEIFLKYLKNICIIEKDLIHISNSLCNSYENSLINTDKFDKLLNHDIKQKLIFEGEILFENLIFRHDLWKEYFHSIFLKNNINILDHVILDNVTNHARNMESLYMAIKQISEIRSIILFITNIYDWNYSETARCLNYILKDNENEKLKDIEIMILAAIAEKRFDRILKTSKSALYLLEESSSTLGKVFAHCTSKEDCNIIVNAHSSKDPKIFTWKKLYCDASFSNQEIIEMIFSDDSIIGWTAANHIRRLNQNYEILDLLCSKYDEIKIDKQKDTIRWRIIHVLGSYSNENSIKTLLDALNQDSYIWVRYGAARSIIEIASLNDEIPCDTVFSKIKECLLKAVVTSKFDFEILKNGIKSFLGIRSDSEWETSILEIKKIVG